MDSQNRKMKIPTIYFRSSYLIFIYVIMLLLSGWILILQLFNAPSSPAIMSAAGIMFTITVVLLFRLMVNSDTVRAAQTDAMLKLSRQIFASMQNGLNASSAHRVCELLLRTTRATAIVIADETSILGCAGECGEGIEPGAPMFAQTLTDALQDGQPRLLLSTDEIGLYQKMSYPPKAIIIEPLLAGRKVRGLLVFLFGKTRGVSETQKSIAEGFAQLISTQIAAGLLEEQTKLATSMSLKALQSQINPHFLFNTINTIASLVRTDPNKARTLLREFAVFYRRTLDDPSNLIPLSQEMEQVKRYFSFEVARFGEDRVCMETDIDPETESLEMPSFLVQPLVENAVQHAMPSEGKLTVTVGSRKEGDSLVRLWVTDDGIGMSEETCANIMHPESQTGIGIAVKNVHDRLYGFFGPQTKMDITSELGKGTTVEMLLDLEAIVAL